MVLNSFEQMVKKNNKFGLHKEKNRAAWGMEFGSWASSDGWTAGSEWAVAGQVLRRNGGLLKRVGGAGEVDGFGRRRRGKVESEAGEQPFLGSYKAYYAQKIANLKIKKPVGHAMIVENVDSDSEGNMDVWLSGSDDEEMRRPTHGTKTICLMARSVESEPESLEYTFASCLSSKSTDDYLDEAKKAIEKVHLLLSKYNVFTNCYEYLLDDLNEKCANLGKMLKVNKRQVGNLTDELSDCRIGIEERNVKIEKLENIKIHNMDDIYTLRKENESLLKQRNMFCNIAKRLYSHITQLYHNSSISEKLHKQMLPFLEMKIDLDAIAFECESIVSETEVKNVTYTYGFEKVNEYLSLKEVEKMINENFTSEDKLKVDLETENQLNSFMNKLHSESKQENIPELEKISCESEDVLSEISEVSELEDVDCSAFVGTSSVEGSEEVGKFFNNNIDSDVKIQYGCNSDNLDNVVNVEIACEPIYEEIHTACESNLKDVENKPACESKQNENVFPEIVKIKDITYKTLKKEGKLKGIYIEKPSSDSSSNSNSSDKSNSSSVKAILFPKLKNVPNQLFVKSRCSKATTSRLSSIIMLEEQYDSQWYIDSGCSRHMIGRKEQLRDFRKLKDGTGLKISFDDEGSVIEDKKSKNVILKSERKGDIRFSYLNFRDINKLVVNNIVRGLPVLKFDNEHLCAACEFGKQSRKSHSSIISTKIVEPLELIHIDLCGPSFESVAGSKYLLVSVDDFSRFIWVYFLKQKSETTQQMIDFIKYVELQLRKPIQKIRKKGIDHNFSAPRTPQQNGAVERRNRSLCEAARSMLNFTALPLYFWAEAILTACFTQNRTYINKRFSIKPYEILNNRKPNVEYEPLVNFDDDFSLFFDEPVKALDSEANADDNKQDELLKIIEDAAENSNITEEQEIQSPIVEGESELQPNIAPVQGESHPTNNTNEVQLQGERIQTNRSEPVVEIVNDSNEDAGNISEIEETIFPNENDYDMNYPPLAELNDFERNKAWRLIPTPPNVSVVGLKWVFRNKVDREGNVVRNKARLTFAPVARIEVVRIFLAYAGSKNFQVYQMDVKCAFLNGELEETVYVEQPLGFVHEKYPDHCYILDKAVYGLKQAPRAWYETLTKFLKQSNFKQGVVDPSLFRKKVGDHLMMVQIYVDDIIFGSTDPKLTVEFKTLMETKFEMSSMGMTVGSKAKVPMAFGTKLKTSLDEPAADQSLYRGMIGSLLYLTSNISDIMFVVCYCARYQSNPRFFVQAYSDSDFGGCNLDLKSTSGGCQFLDRKLASWQSIKQTCVSLSTAETEYIAAATCTSQVLWIQSQLRDYGVIMNKIPLYCDSESAIRICHNPIQHSKTKHIALRYHFIKDHIEEGNIEYTL
ncbi:hypothetical protein LXL04_006280 [Taraxacum kok-saghyz]